MQPPGCATSSAVTVLHAVDAHFFQVLLQVVDPPADFAPVNLELGFARTAQPHAADAACPSSTAACLARQVRPGPSKARQPVFVLRQLDLQDAFAGVGVLRKNIQDQGCAIEDAHVFRKYVFQPTQMAGGQLIIEQDDFRLYLLRKGAHFLDFTRTDKRLGIRVFELLGCQPNNLQTGCVCKQRQLGEGGFQRQQVICAVDLDAHQEYPLAADGWSAQVLSLPSPSLRKLSGLGIQTFKQLGDPFVACLFAQWD